VYWPIYWFSRDAWIRTQRAAQYVTFCLTPCVIIFVCTYFAMWSTALHMNLIGGPLVKNCLIGGHLIDSDLSPQLLPFKASQGSFPWEGGSPQGNERTLYRVPFWYGGDKYFLQGYLAPSPWAVSVPVLCSGTRAKFVIDYTVNMRIRTRAESVTTCIHVFRYLLSKLHM
jgi:hypothetical protein